MWVIYLIESVVHDVFSLSKETVSHGPSLDASRPTPPADPADFILQTVQSLILLMVITYLIKKALASEPSTSQEPTTSNNDSDTNTTVDQQSWSLDQTREPVEEAETTRPPSPQRTKVPLGIQQPAVLRAKATATPAERTEPSSWDNPGTPTVQSEPVLGKKPRGDGKEYSDTLIWKAHEQDLSNLHFKCLQIRAKILKVFDARVVEVQSTASDTSATSTKQVRIRPIITPNNNSKVRRTMSELSYMHKYWQRYTNLCEQGQRLYEAHVAENRQYWTATLEADRMRTMSDTLMRDLAAYEIILNHANISTRRDVKARRIDSLKVGKDSAEKIISYLKEDNNPHKLSRCEVVDGSFTSTRSKNVPVNQPTSNCHSPHVEDTDSPSKVTPDLGYPPTSNQISAVPELHTRPSVYQVTTNPSIPNSSQSTQLEFPSQHQRIQPLTPPPLSPATSDTSSTLSSLDQDITQIRPLSPPPLSPARSDASSTFSTSDQDTVEGNVTSPQANTTNSTVSSTLSQSSTNTSTSSCSNSSNNSNSSNSAQGPSSPSTAPMTPPSIPNTPMETSFPERPQPPPTYSQVLALTTHSPPTYTYTQTLDNPLLTPPLDIDLAEYEFSTTSASTSTSTNTSKPQQNASTSTAFSRPDTQPSLATYHQTLFFPQSIAGNSNGQPQSQSQNQNQWSGANSNATLGANNGPRNWTQDGRGRQNGGWKGWNGNGKWNGNAKWQGYRHGNGNGSGYGKRKDRFA